MFFTVLDLLSEVLSITLIVIMMMLLVDFINVKTQGQILSLMKRYPSLQIVLCAVIGFIPGCVGIFAVVSLYAHRLIGFGALLAAAIASFGDEAFFMLSFIPKQTLWLTLILFLLAILTGYITDYFLHKKKHSQDLFIDEFTEINCNACTDCTEHVHKHKTHHVKHIQLFRAITLAVTGLFIAGILTGAFGDDHEIENSFSIVSHTSIGHSHCENSVFSGENILFLAISSLTFILLLMVNKHFFEEHIWNHILKKHLFKTLFWVLAVILFVRMLSQYVDISTFAYSSWGKYILLLFALLLGFLPVSGPHLIILFLFIDGIIPFSTLIANSILQEGHGGIPLLAYRPKHFLWLKLIKFAIALSIGLLGLWMGF